MKEFYTLSAQKELIVNHNKIGMLICFSFILVYISNIICMLKSVLTIFFLLIFIIIITYFMPIFIKYFINYKMCNLKWNRSFCWFSPAKVKVCVFVCEPIVIVLFVDFFFRYKHKHIFFLFFFLFVFVFKQVTFFLKL